MLCSTFRLTDVPYYLKWTQRQLIRIYILQRFHSFLLVFKREHAWLIYYPYAFPVQIAGRRKSCCVVMHLILMTTLLHKALILQWEMWCWSRSGLLRICQNMQCNADCEWWTRHHTVWLFHFRGHPTAERIHNISEVSQIVSSKLWKPVW